MFIKPETAALFSTAFHNNVTVLLHIKVFSNNSFRVVKKSHEHFLGVLYTIKDLF